jgi:ABC-2 type transport system permease protein
MNLQRILAVIDKEWTQAFKGWSVKITTALTPLVILLGLLFQTQISRLKVVKDILSLNDLFKDMLHDIEVFSNPDDWHRTGDFYLIVFMVLPLFSAVKIASTGIFNDKASRSLEPLLATPLTGGELFLGKILAAVTPAVFCSWISYMVFILTMSHWGIAATTIFGNFKSSVWILSVFVITPLLVIFQVVITFLICSQTGSARLAENISNSMVGLIVAAILCAIIYAAYSFYMYEKQFMLTALLLKVAAGLILLVSSFFLLCINRFQRETILFRWK